MAKRYTARELIRLIEADGWVFVVKVGSHRQYKHPTKPGRVTVPEHGNKVVSPMVVSSIFRQAGLK